MSQRELSRNKGFRMPEEMSLGIPTLRVRNLEDTLEFYEVGFGLRRARSYRDEKEGLEMVDLGFYGRPDTLLTVKHDPDASVPRRDFAGLYHYAVLVPSRRSLASTFLALGNSGVSYDGYADHYVSEALYLHDAELNGIEVYADRSRDTWSSFFNSGSGDRQSEVRRLRALNRPLDFNSLIRELPKEERGRPVRFADGARIGHMHLRVTNLERSVRFYHEALGLDIVSFYPEIGASFLSVGGYHHHIGLNVWNSADGTPHGQNDAGLDRFSVFVPDTHTLDSLESSASSSGSPPRRNGSSLLVTDPDGIPIEFLTKSRA